MSRATAGRLTSVAVLLGLAALWQVASIIIPYLYAELRGDRRGA